MSSLNFIRDLFKSKDSDTRTTLHAPTMTEISIYPGSGPQTIQITTSGSGAVDVVIVDTKTSNASSLPSALPDTVQSTSEDCSSQSEKLPSLWAQSYIENFNAEEHVESHFGIFTTSYGDDGAECYFRSALGTIIHAVCNVVTDEYIIAAHRVPGDHLEAELAPEGWDLETRIRVRKLMKFISATVAWQKGTSPPPYEVDGSWAKALFRLIIANAQVVGRPQNSPSDLNP